MCSQAPVEAIRCSQAQLTEKQVQQLELQLDKT